MSELCAGFEKAVVDADPPPKWGRLIRMGKKSTNALIRVHRSNGDGMPRMACWATREVQVHWDRDPNIILDDGWLGSRTGSYDRRSWVMPVEERAPTSGALAKKMRIGD